jgi:NAD(P)-dependent dehydrogenase (short-subunit alcohol dehydrogenase family)
MKSNELSGSKIAGRVAIITGAGTGMGFEEAKAVAAKGYYTVMACHHPAEAEEKRQEIIRETGNGNVEIIGIELADLSDVRRFADEIKARFDHVDLLMNNAGTIQTGFHLTPDNIEHTVSVNYVGPYLLTRLLLPLMGEGSRIVNMASLTYWMGRLDFPEFFTRGRKRGFHRIHIYCNTKLAITLFTFQLAKLLKGRGITVNAADPWMVSTNIIRMHIPVVDFLADIFFRPVIYTPRKGADTAIRLLLDEDKAGQTGTYNRSNHILDVGEKYFHHRQMQELWDRTEEIVRKYL